MNGSTSPLTLRDCIHMPRKATAEGKLQSEGLPACSLQLHDPSCEEGIKLNKRHTSQRSKCFITFSGKHKIHVLIPNVLCERKGFELARELRSTMTRLFFEACT